MSQLAVFRGEYDTYVLGFQYGRETISLLSSSYIPINKNITIQIFIGNSFHSLVNQSTAEFTCLLDGVVFSAVLSSSDKTLTCDVIFTPSLTLSSLDGPRTLSSGKIPEYDSSEVVTIINKFNHKKL